MSLISIRSSLSGGNTGGETPPPTGGFAPMINGSIIVGDSISIPGVNKWVEQMAAALGVSTYVNRAIAGVGVEKQVQQLFTQDAIGTYPLFAFVGLNDVRVLTGTAVRYELINAGHRAMAAAQFSQNIQFPCASNSNASFSSGSHDGSDATMLAWGSRAYYFKSHGITGAAMFYRPSTTLNETITFASITGTSVVIGLWDFASTHPCSRIKVTIDGVDVVTYDPNNRTDDAAVDGGDAAGVINDAIVIRGLSNTSHSVVLTMLDAGVWAAIDWIGTLKDPADCAPLYVLDIPHLMSGTDIGYDYPGLETSEAILDAAKASRTATLNATFPAYPIAFVPVNDFYTPNFTNTQSDGIHPTAPTGQGLIKDAVLSVMSL